ncbi:MAG: SCO family protein [Acidobacteriota bacterium]|nr:SCO family protein [Acidobacteriota bacterium]
MKFSLSIVALTSVLFGSACGLSHHLKDYGPVPDFSLVSQTGQKLTLADLKGKVWIADTFFTTCTGPCPMMSARMRRVGQSLGKFANVRLVSFTVDPAHDTPAVLLDYSKHFNAEPKRWYFLTGPQSLLNEVSMDGLHLSKVDGSLDHATTFALVDGKANVRGYYHPFDPKQLKQLTSDAEWLAGS